MVGWFVEEQQVGLAHHLREDPQALAPASGEVGYFFVGFGEAGLFHPGADAGFYLVSLQAQARQRGVQPAAHGKAGGRFFDAVLLGQVAHAQPAPRGQGAAVQGFGPGEDL